MISEQNIRIDSAIRSESGRLRRFIRQRVRNAAEAEDILQDVFYELTAADSLLEIEHLGAWLLRVAKNRIIDRFRRKKTDPLAMQALGADDEDEDDEGLDELLPDMAPGPEGDFMRQALREQIETALDELPREQREVFIAHELEGLSFKALAEQTGVSINTLLSRKRYAVLALRERLQATYDEWLASN
jgi:RNA polymerase sigma factor (sigma-70 family)